MDSHCAVLTKTGKPSKWYLLDSGRSKVVDLSAPKNRKSFLKNMLRVKYYIFLPEKNPPS